LHIGTRLIPMATNKRIDWDIAILILNLSIEVTIKINIMTDPMHWIKKYLMGEEGDIK